MSPPLPGPKQSIYYGTFVYPTTRTELSIRHGSLWVSGEGTIAGFESGMRVPDLAERLDWNMEETTIVEAGDAEFFQASNLV